MISFTGFKKKKKYQQKKVAETFLAIKPLLPIPAEITLPLQFAIRSTALQKIY